MSHVDCNRLQAEKLFSDGYARFNRSDVSCARAHSETGKCRRASGEAGPMLSFISVGVRRASRVSSACPDLEPRRRRLCGAFYHKGVGTLMTPDPIRRCDGRLTHRRHTALIERSKQEFRNETARCRSELSRSCGPNEGIGRVRALYSVPYERAGEWRPCGES